MTHEQKIQFIREKCIEANPSIKDLGIDCLALVRQEGYVDPEEFVRVRLLKVSPVTAKIGFNAYIIDPIFFTQVSMYVTDVETGIDVEGRDIRLADVLLAIRNGRYAPTFDYGAFKQSFIIKEENTDADEMFCAWDLLSDSLTDQSPETVDFIYQLLQ